MKKLLLSIFVVSVLALLAQYGYKFYQQSLSSAISVATTAMAAKHKFKVSALKSKQKKKISKLENDSSTKIDKIIRKHKKEIVKAKTRERAKAKVQRIASAVPIIGAGAIALFEKLEFENWKVENPQGTFEQYSIEIGSEVNQLLQEEYREYYEEYKELFNFVGE